MNEMGEKQTSEFNSAITQLNRLNEGWMDCTKYRERGMFGEYKNKLITIEIELDYDINRLNNQDNNYIEEFDKVNQLIEKHAIEKNRIKLHSQLIRKEKLLREVQEEAGKGMKFQDTEYSALDI